MEITLTLKGSRVLVQETGYAKLTHRATAIWLHLMAGSTAHEDKAPPPHVRWLVVVAV
jgi:hypothetical protein